MSDRGIKICPACGQRTRPASRKQPCHDSALCKARVVRMSYDARGWRECTNSTAAKILEESGAPVEWAYGGSHVDVSLAPDGSVLEEWVTHLVGFTPAAAFRALAVLSTISSINAAERRALVGVLWQRDGELLDALEALRRLHGKIPRSVLMQTIRDAEDAKATNPAERVQVP